MATETSPRTLVTGSRGVRSTIFLKLLMALTGLIFIGYVLLHMVGNLKAFAGHDSFNNYAHFIRTIGKPILPYGGFLWIIRIALLISLILHAFAAITLWRRANSARTTAYVVKKNVGSSVSSHWMRWGGVALLLFTVWHLINFTFGKVNVTGAETNDPFNLLYDTFSTWWMTLIYLAAMAALALHLHHGTWSAAQTLGLTNTAASRRNAKAAGLVLAVVIAGGFSLVPLAILTGIIEK